jgi:hypothetical protein
MTELNCEFCNKIFSTKSNLLNHQKTAKYCLIRQGKQNKKYTCDLCEKEFTINQTLQEHYINCLKINYKHQERLKKKENEYQDKLKEKDNLIIQLQEQIKQKEYDYDLNNKQINDIVLQLRERETQKDEYISKIESLLAKANETIATIAMQPKTTTNNTDNRVSHITNNFDINNIEKMTSMLENHLTPDVMRRGQEGVADMLKTHLLQTSNGDPMYECTDVARQKFEFRNADGNMETDPKATKLIRNLGRSGMWNKAHSTGKKLWEKADGTVNTDAMVVFMPNVTEVLEIDKDSSKLRRRLASITARQRAPVVSASSASSASSK